MNGRQLDRDTELARQSRMVAVVIAVIVLVWLGANSIGPAIGLPGRYAILFDLLALAGFVWVMFVTYQIWRKRRQS